MKIRNGFVSNSSSSSFMILIDEILTKDEFICFLNQIKLFSDDNTDVLSFFEKNNFEFSNINNPIEESKLIEYIKKYCDNLFDSYSYCILDLLSSNEINRGYTNPLEIDLPLDLKLYLTQRYFNGSYDADLEYQIILKIFYHEIYEKILKKTIVTITYDDVWDSYVIDNIFITLEKIMKDYHIAFIYC